MEARRCAPRRSQSGRRSTSGGGAGLASDPLAEPVRAGRADGHRVRAALAALYGADLAVASTSGTAAIHIAIGAINPEPGDEIITAPITDGGTIVPILYQNAIPVFADIDRTYNMDPASVERQITPRTKAILVVHLFGNPCDMDAMVDIACRHGLWLIEDCSQAHQTTYKGRLLGYLGDVGCFSLQQSKHMTTGDGGVTITNNLALANRLINFRDKGWNRQPGWVPAPTSSWPPTTG